MDPQPACAAEPDSLGALLRTSTQLSAPATAMQIRCLHAPSPRSLSFSADGSVVVSQASSLRIWNAEDGVLMQSISGPTPFGHHVQLNAGRLIATVDDAQAFSDIGWSYEAASVLPLVRVWDVLSGRQLAAKALPLPANASSFRLSQLAVSSSSEGILFVVVGYQDGFTPYHPHVLGYRVPTLQLLYDASLDQMESDVSVKMSESTGQILVYDSRRVVLLKAETGAIVFERLLGTKDRHLIRVDDSKALGSNPDAPQLHVAMFNVPDERYYRGSLDLKGGEYSETIVPAGKSRWIESRSALLCEEDASVWDYVSTDLGLTKWSLFSGESVASFHLPMDIIRYRAISRPLQMNGPRVLKDIGAAAIHGASKRLAVAVRDDEAFYIIDMSSGRVVGEPYGTVSALSRVDGSCIGSVVDAHRVTLFESYGDNRHRVLSLEEPATAIAVSQSQMWLVLGKHSGGIQIRSLHNLQVLAERAVSDCPVAAVVCDAGHRFLLIADYKSRLWQIEWSGDPLVLLPPRRLLPNIMFEKEPRYIIAPPEETIALTSNFISLAPPGSDSLAFVQFTTAKPAVSWPPGSSALSDPGRTLVVRGWTVRGDGMSDEFNERIGAVLVTDVVSGLEKWLAPAGRPMDSVVRIGRSADGQVGIVAFQSGRVVLTDIRTLQLHSIIDTGVNDIVDVTVLSDGVTLLVARYGGVIQTWSIPKVSLIDSIHLGDCRLSAIASADGKGSSKIIVGTRDCGVISVDVNKGNAGR